MEGPLMDDTHFHPALWWQQLASAIDRYTRLARSRAEKDSRPTGNCRECGAVTKSVVMWRVRAVLAAREEEKTELVFLCPACGEEIRRAS